MEDIRRMEAETQKELEEVRPVCRTGLSHLRNTENSFVILLFGVLVSAPLHYVSVGTYVGDLHIVVPSAE